MFRFRFIPTVSSNLHVPHLDPHRHRIHHNIRRSREMGDNNSCGHWSTGDGAVFASPVGGNHATRSPQSQSCLLQLGAWIRRLSGLHISKWVTTEFGSGGSIKIDFPSLFQLLTYFLPSTWTQRSSRTGCMRSYQFSQPFTLPATYSTCTCGIKVVICCQRVTVSSMSRWVGLN